MSSISNISSLFPVSNKFDSPCYQPPLDYLLNTRLDSTCKIIQHLKDKGVIETLIAFVNDPLATERSDHSLRSDMIKIVKDDALISDYFLTTFALAPHMFEPLKSKITEIRKIPSLLTIEEKQLMPNYKPLALKNADLTCSESKQNRFHLQINNFCSSDPGY